MPYSTYNHDSLEPSSKLRIERTGYFDIRGEDISPLTAQPLAELLKMREESAAQEQAIYAALQAQASAWEEQAGRTALLDRALAYVRTPPVKHTSNKWTKNQNDWQERSNMVYRMTAHIYEHTRYDREQQKSVPYSWSVSWGVYTNGPDTGRNVKIAGQERKTYNDKAAMEKYLAGRIKAYDNLFTEISPPIPQIYAAAFKVNGQLLPGYTVEGEEPQKSEPEQPPKDTPETEPEEKTPETENAEIPAEQTGEEKAEPVPVKPIILTAENSADRMKEITGKLEDGIKELFDSDRYREYLSVMSRFHRYSFNNTLLIAMQKPDASHVAGFTAWKDNFKRNVMKDQKGIKIIAPAPFTVEKEVEKKDPRTGQPMIGQDGKPIMEKKEVQIPAYKVVSVFDVSQTEGEPLPTLGVHSLTGDVERYEDFFKALKETSPVPVEFEKIKGSAHGYYSLTDKRIALDEGMSELQTIKTAIHEIAHAKLHDIDLKAPKSERQDRPDDRTREVQAESVAYTVCQHYGLDTSDYSFGYVAGWSSGREMSELKASLETIRKTASEIISSIDGKMAELQKEHEQSKTQEQEKPLSPDDMTTGKSVVTPRGSFHETAMSREQMEAAGYGVHHRSEDGKHLIMGNGTRAFAVSAQEQPDQDRFSIYQLKRGEDMRELRFAPHDRLTATGHTVDPQNYDLVYSAPLTPDMTLGDIWRTFNLDHPADFKGHSLSVSDVVVIHRDGQDKAHYVDSFGYKDVPEFFQPESHIKTAEMSTEQNQNMIDGLMNNTPTAAELEAKAKAGEVISITELAGAIQAEKGRGGAGKEEKPSIRAQLKAAKERRKNEPKKAQTKSKNTELEV